ncbi:mitochondrial ribosomal protein L49 [Lampris incognitus]|uniref:mitochondrial ribosomal protein L49 n=1 Tax=Lampris incognitus TaxID=2546036 RepID=UPI0024B61475|nr:mitochondrial ribosomal protein L49 [Lampris incognitus]
MAAFTSLRSPALRGGFGAVCGLHRRTAGLPRPAPRPQPACSFTSEDKTNVYLESTDEYHYVERLIPPSRVPQPPRHDKPPPSGWVPPPEVPPPLPYMIRRSRMHNIPVYSDITHGNRPTTLVRRVEGDIWALEKDVKEFLKQAADKDLPTRVNEVTMTLRVKGKFDVELKEWLIQKGF